MGGGSTLTLRESPIVSAAFLKRSQNRKNASALDSLKFREVSNSFCEGTRREKTSLKKVSFLLTH